MFKGYISKTFGNAQWKVSEQQLNLLPQLSQLSEDYNCRHLTILRNSPYKVVGEFSVTSADSTQTYIVKIYRYYRFFQKIKLLFRRAKAFHEFHLNCIATEKGVSTEPPVACGRRKTPFFYEYYIIIKKQKGALTLREFFKKTVSRKARRDLLEKFGIFAKKIHDEGIRQDDFSLDNFLVYNDVSGGNRLALIDFERVSIQKNSLKRRYRIFYLAKLNRTGRFFSGTDRLRFLLSYTGNDRVYCKDMARDIERVTVSLQKKDARKFWHQCVHENRKFSVVKNNEFYGYHRRDCSVEILTGLLNDIGRTTQNSLSREQFFISCLTLHHKKNKIWKTNSHYYALRAWRQANALFALRINVPVPVGIFLKTFPGQSRAGYLISKIPDNCIPLKDAIYSLQDKASLLSAILRLEEQVSAYGIFRRDLNLSDIIIQKTENHYKAYLVNYTSLCLNRQPVHKNKLYNQAIIKQLFQVPPVVS